MSFVMLAWIAGIQVRKDAFGDIHVNWIPALHAGMTQSSSLLEWRIADNRLKLCENF
jgi:hypothetical protein